MANGVKEVSATASSGIGFFGLLALLGVLGVGPCNSCWEKKLQIDGVHVVKKITEGVPQECP